MKVGAGYLWAISSTIYFGKFFAFGNKLSRFGKSHSLHYVSPPPLMGATLFYTQIALAYSKKLVVFKKMLIKSTTEMFSEVKCRMVKIILLGPIKANKVKIIGNGILNFNYYKNRNLRKTQI